MMTTTTENQHCVAGPCQVNLEALLLKGGCATHSVDFFVFQEPNLIGRVDFLCAQPLLRNETHLVRSTWLVIGTIKRTIVYRTTR